MPRPTPRRRWSRLRGDDASRRDPRRPPPRRGRFHATSTGRRSRPSSDPTSPTPSLPWSRGRGADRSPRDTASISSSFPADDAGEAAALRGREGQGRRRLVAREGGGRGPRLHGPAPRQVPGRDRPGGSGAARRRCRFRTWRRNDRTGTSPSTPCWSACCRSRSASFSSAWRLPPWPRRPPRMRSGRPISRSRRTRPGEFNVLFKTPMRGDMRLDLSVAFSGKVENLTPVVSRANRGRHGPDLAAQGDRAARRPVGRSSTASRRR